MTEIQPRYELGQLQEIAEQVAKSGLFKMTAPQVLTLMLLAESEGIHPMKAMMRYHIIEGKPSMRADAMQAEFQRAGGRIEWTKDTTEECEAVFYHDTQCPNGKTVSFSMKDAERAGLATRPIWKSHPRPLMRARVVTNGIRMILPGVIMGIYSEDEAEDAPAPIETQARASLVERLGKRLESPKESHPPVAETAAELKQAPEPEKPAREPESAWGKMIAGAVLEFNQALAELAEANPSNLALRKGMSPQQAINGVVKALVAEGLQETALQTNGKRDAAKVRAMLDDIWENDSEHLEGVTAKYLGGKMTELMGPPAPVAQGELAMA